MDFTYEQIAGLGLTPLRMLLRNGDPVERVWAAWALGLRLGGQITKELAPRWRDEPDAGVRRHVAVVLAGAGERDGLAAIAQSDPDEHVRASAVQLLLLQTARPHEVAATVDQIIAFVRSDGHPVVVERVLELLESRWPAAKAGVLFECLAASALPVREAAMRALRWSGLLSARGAWVAALERAPIEQLGAMLDAVPAGIHFEWRELTRLAQAGVPAFELQLMELLRVPATADVDFLISRALGADGRLSELALRALASKRNVPRLTARQRECIEELVGTVVNDRRRLEPEWFELCEEGAYEEAVEELERLEAGLLQLLY